MRKQWKNQNNAYAWRHFAAVLTHTYKFITAVAYPGDLLSNLKHLLHYK